MNCTPRPEAARTESHSLVFAILLTLVQGDTSGRTKPFVDIKTKVAF